ncbi:carbonic anhydrase [Streptomyces sp. NRRL B-24484]|uniref:carbonic anhydrase n=1 Tax=Streptomyces sp. NRRL B-24484 TaxID=1463833 RepID=UPI0006945D8A|nr:carbonic anhydrase [Streptomyces sp. NRRL B-24484]
MQELTDGLRRFRREAFPPRAALFADLAARHRPGTLFIGCSDSRVVPELITQSEPGELFVVRTAGNLVPPHPAGADAVAASIEYAVGVLGVSDVVVCGHSGCGAMTALVTGDGLDRLPSVAAWLRHGAGVADEPDPGVADAPVEHRVAALVRANVATQLARLRTHPAVAEALDRQALTLHGWVYDIASGTVETYDRDADRFAALPC